MKKPPSHSIEYQQFGFGLTAKEPLILPAYKGSTLRGGFGYAFKRVVCAVRDKECPDCLLKERCIYSYVFETPPPSDTKIMRKYRSAPHPFVIEPPPEKRREYKPGDKINFSLILIGRAIDYLPYFIYTFDELGRTGIGKGRAKYELQDVSCDGTTIYDSSTKTLKSFKTSSLPLSSYLSLRGEAEAILLGPQIPPLARGEFEGSENNPPVANLQRSVPPLANQISSPTLEKGGKGGFFNKQLKLNFLTPTRILYDGRLTLNLEFHILIRNLLRRLSLLYYFHCNGDPSEWDFKGIIEMAKEVKVKESNLRWYDWERYSGRQETRMKMGGFVGEITFDGNVEPFMPLIKAGEVLHVGKGTGFGLGKYKIVKGDSEE
jgi:CRISPR-associated endoribonuclease Cas6